MSPGRAAGARTILNPAPVREYPASLFAHVDVVAEVGAPNLKVQMDLYHCQIVEGDVAMKIRQYLPTGNVGHFQIAGVPERHEPDIGELNYPYLFSVIDEVAAQCGWAGWIGCEYKPRRGGEPGGPVDRRHDHPVEAVGILERRREGGAAIGRTGRRCKAEERWRATRPSF